MKKIICEILSFLGFPCKSILTKMQVEFLNHTVKGSWSHNPLTGLVDVIGDIVIDYSSSHYVTDNILPVNFGIITGDFVAKNLMFISVANFPLEIHGMFRLNNVNLRDCDWKVRKLKNVEFERINMDRMKMISTLTYFLSDEVSITMTDENRQNWQNIIDENLDIEIANKLL